MNKEFIQDRTNLLINLDNIRIEEVEEYCKKYNIPILTNKRCMVAGLHKARIYSIEKGTIEMNNEYYNLLEEKMARLINETQELKKQLEERTKMYQNAYDYSQKMEGKAIILEIQQKEFIKYLEDEIQNKREKSTTLTAFIRNVVPLQQCLQKYKEIIEKGDVR